ncbi:hypothetical protein JCM9140_4389 [Halalkalibacter wakoensis JCM 9140]|uniref:Prepilin-type N-terminal cleavage/methylation domain-containing protein n=2 Tax=Halalkalibacter wakoensis TaxID=127891 RepID=W4Q868_9BACI|nr:hypothetical protein JCM9140_4389 [Halalkalibacter wakoensis JCM 9140]
MIPKVPRKLFVSMRREQGLTLVEILVVVVMIGIIAAIAVPLFIGVIEKAEEDVCGVNVMHVERGYERWLVLEDVEHSELVFSQYVVENEVGGCEGCEGEDDGGGAVSVFLGWIEWGRGRENG